MSQAVNISNLSMAATAMRLKDMPSAASFEVKKLLTASRAELVHAQTVARLRESHRDP